MGSACLAVLQEINLRLICWLISNSSCVFIFSLLPAAVRRIKCKDRSTSPFFGVQVHEVCPD
uniref:Uncharacterized protein n=1 Tax=Arundo donax TaxID=35708 RepID=A0A0A9DA09_ARUDO